VRRNLFPASKPVVNSWAKLHDAHGRLEKAMTHLNDRERHILTKRRLRENPTTLEDLSQQYGISRERVRQIEVRAFEKLQKAIKAAAIERRLVTH
jgi:RNA polymerase sigma-32 factor